MVHALIFAGGMGTRMKSEDLPKQFIEVDGKAIIIRTLEHFSHHNEVDKIVIVCVESWIDYLLELLKINAITKVSAVIPGGRTGYDSIHNGLIEIAGTATDEDIVLICDGVRPVLTKELISNCIKMTYQYGSAVPVVSSIDSVLVSANGQSCRQNMPRKDIYITQAPQGYFIKNILWAHNQAEYIGKTTPVSSADLMIELGKEIYLFEGDRDNIKVTTPEDLQTLRAHYYYSHYKHFAMEELKYGL